MDLRSRIALPAAFLLLVAVPAAATEPRPIEIQIDGAPRFDVIYHRALTNMAGATFGGLIGAGIQAGMESGKDEPKRKALEPHVSERVWNDAFVKTLNEALQAKGFEPTWIEGGSKSSAGMAAYLTIFPASYGFRMVDTTTALVSPYVEFKASYARQPIKRDGKSPKEPFYMAGEKQAPYEQWLAETSTLQADVEAVLARAARRLANKIIYNLQ
jgi:hypothetical protein